MKLFTFLDVKANYFMNPFSERDTISALRSFKVAANDPKSTFNKFPDDFCLMELGSFDPQTGSIDLLSAPNNLATARSLIEAANVL